MEVMNTVTPEMIMAAGLLRAGITEERTVELLVAELGTARPIALEAVVYLRKFKFRPDHC